MRGSVVSGPASAVETVLDCTTPSALRLRPLGLMSDDAAAQAAVEAGSAMPLAGGPLAFTLVELAARRHPDGEGSGGAVSAVGTIAAIREAARRRGGDLEEAVQGALGRLSAARAPWAGLSLDGRTGPLLMGIVNVTPDSFSDGGYWLDAGRAVEHGRALLEAGAHILDIGGESTRPGATPVAPEEEIRRIEPVIRALAEAGAVVSVDTRHAPVMRAAVAAGARIINDVSALAADPDSIAAAASCDAGIVLMHMRGNPATMLSPSMTSYDAPAALVVYDELAERLDACIAAGIARDRIVVDPGIGFAKLAIHNLEVLSHLPLFHGFGCGVLLGLSRKSFIGRLDRDMPPKARVPGSLAGALQGLAQGVQILRVHDVAETRQAVAVWRAIQAATPADPVAPGTTTPYTG
ncbi:MAG TPA: dihydropteroate synthase [Stellaceae bacterium]